MAKISRRTFLWLTGGSSIALASDQPRKLVNKLIPQLIPPENIEPGEWTAIATTCRECPAGCGMHLSHRDGRVTKAEGNPQHPVNHGTLCPRGQASLQGLYDPDRVQHVLNRPKGATSTRKMSWDSALNDIAGRLAAGGKVAVISSLQTGVLADLMTGFCAAFGSKRLVFYEPLGYPALKKAHQELFGQAVVPMYDLAHSDLIISFGADFLETWISPVSFATQFANRRDPNTRMNRLIYVGPRLSMTASNADEYLQVAPGQERLLLAGMLKIIIDRGWSRNNIKALKPAIDRIAGEGPIQGTSRQKLIQLTFEFITARSSVALAGPQGAASTPAILTATLVALLNYAAGRIGQTVDFSRPHATSNAAGEEDLQRFFASLGPKDILLVHDCNPVYTRPQSAQFIARAGMVVYLGTMEDETARTAEWILPMDYPLETWGDYESDPAIYSLIQPTMARLYDTRNPGEILLELARRARRPIRGSSGIDFLSLLKKKWAGVAGDLAPTVNQEQFWTNALRNGGVWKRTPSSASVNLRGSAASFLSSLQLPKVTLESDMGELWLWPSIMLFDGRLANRGWLQEAPDPISFVVWGNRIDLNPARAARLGLKQGDLAELTTSTGSIKAPVRVTEEVGEQTCALAFGQGHTALGKNAAGIGANAFALLNNSDNSSNFGVCRIRRIGPAPENQLTITIGERRQHEREIVRWKPLSRLEGETGENVILPLPEGYRPDKDIYPKRVYMNHRWAMVIDLQRCIGCGACAVACYAENNIAVVGKEKVGNGREMAWLRVTPYVKPGGQLRYGWLPMLCQHCDAAPCEPVCPVFAAMHNEEGLNAQIYNRCIGTRYCSNNCPYKVRRFNWVNATFRKPLDLQLNPEVTVRSRGVMEKCTFCVQRIRQVEYRAAREERKIRDGEIQPACVQTCPATVFTFGDLLDPESRVSKLTRKDPRRYHVLEELNTKPAVTYLKKVDLDA